jgi:hypothetical protein
MKVSVIVGLLAALLALGAVGCGAGASSSGSVAQASAEDPTSACTGKRTPPDRGPPPARPAGRYTRGGYVLLTIVPNHYLRRPPHIHVRVQAPNGPVLETQLFFPGKLRAYGMHVAALNAHDRSFKPALTVRLGPRRGNRYAATFDFVIAVTP